MLYGRLVFCLVFISQSNFFVHSYPQDTVEEGQGGDVPGLFEETIHEIIELESTPSDDTISTTPVSTCNVVGSIKCFTDVLDEWMLHLWNFKTNIITINAAGCEHHRLIHFCANYPGCTKAEVLNTSRIITDMILHRKGSGSFLKSYYFTEYACTPEGQEIIGKHRDCLTSFRINEKAMYFSRYMEDVIMCKISGKSAHECRHMEVDNWDSDEWYCDFLKTKANDLYVITKEECSMEPAFLMCKGINDIFVNLYPEQLQYCQVPCAKIEEPKPSTANGKASPHDGNGPNTGTTFYRLTFWHFTLSFCLTSYQIFA